MKTSTSPRLLGLVDTLGGINAEIALLEAQAKVIKAELLASGEETLVGSMYSMKVVVAERCTIDADKVRKILGPDCPMKSAFVTSVRTSARV